VFFGYWGIMTLYIQKSTALHFTSNDKAAGIDNIPPRIITGFLRANKENVGLYKESFDAWDKPRKWQ
jgi:hypothetical protein